MSRMIDADAFDRTLEDAELEAKRNRKYVFASALNIIRGNLRNAPTIEERKTGKWIQDQKSKRCRCDQCLSFALKTDDMQENLSDFCPVCCADMREQP